MQITTDASYHQRSSTERINGSLTDNCASTTINRTTVDRAKPGGSASKIANPTMACAAETPHSRLCSFGNRAGNPDPSHFASAAYVSAVNNAAMSGGTALANRIDLWDFGCSKDSSAACSAWRPRTVKAAFAASGNLRVLARKPAP